MARRSSICYRFVVCCMLYVAGYGGIVFQSGAVGLWFFLDVLCSDCPTALIAACDCSITHTNVHSCAPFITKTTFPFFPPHCGLDCHRLSNATIRVRSLRSTTQREQCHIHKRRHQLSSSLPRHSHEWKFLSPQT